MFDVDIDIQPSLNKSKYGIHATQVINDNKLKHHNSGIYVDVNIPVDGITGWAAIEYKEAEELGFIKLDFLNNTSYNIFESKEEVLRCQNIEPDWNLFLEDKVLETLPQISSAVGKKAVKTVKPQCIEDLADAIALMRPGKSHLLDRYHKNKYETRQNLYRKGKSGYVFKKSHAIAYATMIVCVLNKKYKL